MGPQGPRDRRSKATEHKRDEDVGGLQSEASVESAKKKATKKKAVKRKVTRKKTAKSRVTTKKVAPKKTRARRR